MQENNLAHPGQPLRSGGNPGGGGDQNAEAYVCLEDICQTGQTWA